MSAAPHWDRSEIDQLVLLMGREPPARRAAIAQRLGRSLGAIDKMIYRLRENGSLAPSTWAIKAAMLPEQHEVLALYRRKDMPAWEGIRAALASYT